MHGLTDKHFLPSGKRKKSRGNGPGTHELAPPLPHTLPTRAWRGTGAVPRHARLFCEPSQPPFPSAFDPGTWFDGKNTA
jgi:hypothetical protein